MRPLVTQSRDFKKLKALVPRYSKDRNPSYDHWTVSGRMIEWLGINGAVLLSHLISEYVAWVQTNSSKDGWFPLSVEELRNTLRMTPAKQSKIIDSLSKTGLIDCERRGKYGPRMIKVNLSKMVSFLDGDYP